ncbi:unnamed protein product [Leptosia nina]|uniref:Uncharacterized protein n=1 Tax=Leptosia nina TaxID=320188 RepID=A0AAV1JRS7_9NEOP
MSDPLRRGRTAARADRIAHESSRVHQAFPRRSDDAPRFGAGRTGGSRRRVRSSAIRHGEKAAFRFQENATVSSGPVSVTRH